MADADGRKDFKLEQLPQIYPSYGYTDLRGPAFAFLYADGSRTTDLRYASHRICSGKRELKGLPAVRPSQDCQTLELRLADFVQSIFDALLHFVNRTIIPTIDGSGMEIFHTAALFNAVRS